MQNKIIQQILEAEAQGEDIVKKAREDALQLVADARVEAKVIQQKTLKAEVAKLGTEADSAVVERFKADYEKQSKELRANATKKYPAIVDLVVKYIKSSVE